MLLNGVQIISFSDDSGLKISYFSYDTNNMTYWVPRDFIWPTLLEDLFELDLGFKDSLNGARSYLNIKAIIYTVQNILQFINHYNNCM